MVSTNIANVNVPGYKRQDMDFSIQLDDAMGERRIDRLASRFGGLDPASQSSVRVDGNSVDIEHEVVSLTEMQIRYQALTDMTSRHFKGLKNVIKGGR
jgi:flagellar basal-body rod protein FlgB